MSNFTLTVKVMRNTNYTIEQWVEDEEIGLSYDYTIKMLVESVCEHPLFQDVEFKTLRKRMLNEAASFYLENHFPLTRKQYEHYHFNILTEFYRLNYQNWETSDDFWAACYQDFGVNIDNENDVKVFMFYMFNITNKNKLSETTTHNHSSSQESNFVEAWVDDVIKKQAHEIKVALKPRDEKCFCFLEKLNKKKKEFESVMNTVFYTKQTPTKLLAVNELIQKTEALKSGVSLDSNWKPFEAGLNDANVNALFSELKILARELKQYTLPETQYQYRA